LTGCEKDLAINLKTTKKQQKTTTTTKNLAIN